MVVIYDSNFGNKNLSPASTSFANVQLQAGESKNLVLTICCDNVSPGTPDTVSVVGEASSVPDTSSSQHSANVSVTVLQPPPSPPSPPYTGSDNFSGGMGRRVESSAPSLAISGKATFPSVEPVNANGDPSTGSNIVLCSQSPDGGGDAADVYIAATGLFDAYFELGHNGATWKFAANDIVHGLNVASIAYWCNTDGNETSVPVISGGGGMNMTMELPGYKDSSINGNIIDSNTHQIRQHYVVLKLGGTVLVRYFSNEFSKYNGAYLERCNTIAQTPTSQSSTFRSDGSMALNGSWSNVMIWDTNNTSHDMTSAYAKDTSYPLNASSPYYITWSPHPGPSNNESDINISTIPIFTSF